MLFKEALTADQVDFGPQTFQKGNSMNDNCVSVQELREFLLGQLSEEQNDRIDFHLQRCDECEDTVAGFDLTMDSLVGELRDMGDKFDSAAATNNPIGSQGNADAAIIDDPNFRSAMSNAKEIVAIDFDLAVDDSEMRKSNNIERPECPRKIGQYEVVELLGYGGMGSVYRARHSQLEKEVAVKILPDRKMYNSVAIARFTREMKLVGRMDHPAMVSATDAGRDDGVHFLVMELVDGLDLSKIIRKMGPLSISDACELVRQSAMGLDYAHAQGVIHRDVKPSNLMLNRDGKVKVLDLGLATLGGMNAPEDQLTTVGQLMGTLDYMAPEQCGNHRASDERSDIYGLGATLYRLLTGKSPYSSPQNNTPLKKIKAMAMGDGVSIRDRVPLIPVELAAIVDRCLQRDPDNRYQSASQVADELSPFCDGSHLSNLINDATFRASAVEDPTPSEVDREFDNAADQLRGYLQNKSSNQSVQSNSHAKALPAKSGWYSGFAKAAALLLLFGGFTWGGIVLYLQTSMGRLRIESEIEDVQVTVVQDGKEIEQLKVETGEDSTRLWAGKYKVEIRGKSDGVLIKEDVYEVKRGETTIAKIAKADAERVGPGKVSAGDDSAPDKSTEERYGLGNEPETKFVDPELKIKLSTGTLEFPVHWSEPGPKPKHADCIYKTRLGRINSIDWVKNMVTIDLSNIEDLNDGDKLIVRGPVNGKLSIVGFDGNLAQARILEGEFLVGMVVQIEGNRSKLFMHLSVPKLTGGVSVQAKLNRQTNQIQIPPIDWVKEDHAPDTDLLVRLEHSRKRAKSLMEVMEHSFEKKIAPKLFEEYGQSRQVLEQLKQQDPKTVAELNWYISQLEQRQDVKGQLIYIDVSSATAIDKMKASPNWRSDDELKKRIDNWVQELEELFEMMRNRLLFARKEKDGKGRTRELFLLNPTPPVFDRANKLMVITLTDREIDVLRFGRPLMVEIPKDQIGKNDEVQLRIEVPGPWKLQIPGS